jgi:hypothetical protein
MEHERRESVRVPCELPSSLRNIGSIIDTTACFASDISNDGANLVLPKFIPLSARLILSMNIPQYHTIEIRVTPVWVSEEPAISSFQLGVRFGEIIKEDKIAIHNFQRTAAKPIPAILTRYKTT